jgi:hypothetical protein
VLVNDLCAGCRCRGVGEEGRECVRVISYSSWSIGFLFMVSIVILSMSAGIRVRTKPARSSKTIHQQTVRERGIGDALNCMLPSIASGSVNLC